MVSGTLYTKGETGNTGATRQKVPGGAATQSNLGHLSALEKDSDTSNFMKTPSKLKLSVQ